MQKFKNLILLSLLLLTACATAPSVQLKSICPQIPPLGQAAPDQDFIGPMQSFLSGKLNGPTNYGLTSPNAKLHTTPPVTR